LPDVNSREPVKVVSFDIDGTLADERFSRLVWEEAIPRIYARKENIDAESGKRHVYKEYSKIGKERLEWYDIQYWFQHFGLNQDWRELLESYKHEVHLYPEVPSVLRKLEPHYVLIVVTNAATEFAEILTKDIKSYFLHVFSATSDFKVLKSSPRLYELVCEKLAIAPKDLTHVGDHRKFDYSVPRTAGVEAYLLDRTRGTSNGFVVKNLEDFCSRIGV
jgi:HAD superfamily hydrolase (TIGR01493 family)